MKSMPTVTFSFDGFRQQAIADWNDLVKEKHRQWEEDGWDLSDLPMHINEEIELLEKIERHLAVMRHIYVDGDPNFNNMSNLEVLSIRPE